MLNLHEVHLLPFKIKTDAKLFIELSWHGLAENMKLTFEIHLQILMVGMKTYMSARYRNHNTNLNNLKDVR